MRNVSVGKINTTFFSNPRRDRSRTLLFVLEDEGVPDRLRFAIERDLPMVTIEECDGLGTIANSYRDTIALVVISPSHVAEMEARASEILRFHPLARVAVMTNDSTIESHMAQQLQTSTVINGVLPMQMKLDVLTPILALLMRGGEYYPRLLVQPAPTSIPEVRPAPEPAKAGPNHLSFLTKREHQILALVARGLQNKSIASDLRLSEHTVKIHLHNIITKLGTHNRTEAAAVFRDSGGAAQARVTPMSAAN
ncbi:helix-turn-helix transcriptional regulator [Devosia submarina]|uniref:helix-turn-helix transcriptional regulator n=1 Tax=Devosia submarina TaxID=1173082 RepID=UPI000D3CACF2|nr:response regulator transcription factor [Devosia submarina]